MSCKNGILYNKQNSHDGISGLSNGVDVGQLGDQHDVELNPTLSRIKLLQHRHPIILELT